jgi:hypothetical protein
MVPILSFSVIGSDCSKSSACPGDANAMCKSDKCECKEGYAEKNDVCTQSNII